MTQQGFVRKPTLLEKKLLANAQKDLKLRLSRPFSIYITRFPEDDGIYFNIFVNEEMRREGTRRLPIRQIGVPEGAMELRVYEEDGQIAVIRIKDLPGLVQSGVLAEDWMLVYEWHRKYEDRVLSLAMFIPTPEETGRLQECIRATMQACFAG